ncbi:mitogen-activated protein kinase kinase kinase 17-like, partial [Impatiens glandulifera]|uniref:mitogen-activated protein kinase kinase kinase 17-like n=1 Tax=Impatiens glandulifera TaxID=253017 RepID=UPI001FB16249
MEDKPRTQSISSWVRGNCIGRGSFGTVNLALTHPHGRVLAAAKSVQISSQAANSQQIQALENEIQILSSVSSPWVVQYIGDDVSRELNGSYRNLLMEYLPGGTVADLPPPLSGGAGNEEVVKSYTWCITSALRYIHSKGIVHCDVKGRNILLGPNPGTAKLADFGSAILIHDDEIKVRPTRGSPLWMAPEVIRGEYQGFESDLWSLGCTVIEMLTGKPAWEDNGADTLIKIGYSDKVPDFPNGLSEIGRDFLDKCLRRNRAERWSCDQLLEHPFISSSAAPEFNLMTRHHPSPRCVLDWPSIQSEYFSEEEIDMDSTKRRIGKLVSNTEEINWESDGWTEVRNLVGDGKSEEYPNCSNYGQDRGVILEDDEFGGGEAIDGGRRRGSECCRRDGGWLTVLGRSQTVFDNKKSMELTIFDLVKLLCVILVRFQNLSLKLMNIINMLEY